MIQQLFFYKRKVILTVYYDFDCQIKTRCIKEKLSGGIVYLEERFLNEPDVEDVAACRQVLKIEEGLFDFGKTNSYTDPFGYFNRIYVYVKHFLCADKPNSIFSGANISELQCEISDVELSSVLNFIKRYSGLDLYEKPVYIGDVLIFRPHVFNIRSNNDWQLIVSHLKKGMHVTAILFQGNHIAGYCECTATSDTEEACLSPKCKWSYTDVTITYNGKVVYHAKGLLFLRNLCVQGHIHHDKFVPLKKIASGCHLDVSELHSQSAIGHEADKRDGLLYQKNSEIAKKLKNLEISVRFKFISDKPEMQIVLEKIKDVMSEAQKELWVFDAYFTDSKNGLDKAIDWLRIIANLQAKKKYVVFYNRKNEKTISEILEFEKLVKSDTECARVIRNNGKLYVNFIQTIKPIHDRFVIGLKDNGEYIGLSVGTSFNSLDSNFYCITELSTAETKQVYCTLTSWIYEKGMGESLEI